MKENSVEEAVTHLKWMLDSGMATREEEEPFKNAIEGLNKYVQQTKTIQQLKEDAEKNYLTTQRRHETLLGRQIRYIK